MKAAGRVMLDLAGIRLDATDRVRLKHPTTGGVILFSRNFESRGALLELVREIRAVRPDLLVAVDQEGGRVQRLQGDGFTRLPAMRRLGQVWDLDPFQGAIHATELATSLGYVLASELMACGIDLSFTPVLDLDYGVSSVIGDRAFHRDARVVTLLAKSLNHGLLLAGMANCGKHFPGHGFVAADSHVALPVDARSLDQILAADAAPYAWLGESLAAVMPAHVRYPKVDPKPAGFSRKWLQQVLRQRLGFQGAIFSDDLSMEGAQGEGGVVKAAEKAIRAGCDMVLVCNAPERADQLLRGLSMKADSDAARRLSNLRRAGAPGSREPAKDPAYHAALRRLHPLCD